MLSPVVDYIHRFLVQHKNDTESIAKSLYCGFFKKYKIPEIIAHKINPASGKITMANLIDIFFILFIILVIKLRKLLWSLFY